MLWLMLWSRDCRTKMKLMKLTATFLMISLTQVTVEHNPEHSATTIGSEVDGTAHCAAQCDSNSPVTDDL